MEIHQVRFHVDNLPVFLQKLRLLGQNNQCSLICFNREAIAGKQHVSTALRFAMRSFRSDSAISRSIEVEALLYAAGTRQTGLIGPFGIHLGDNICYLCILPPRKDTSVDLQQVMEFADDENWEEIPEDKRERLGGLFGITHAEIRVAGREKLIDLILERVALLNINR